MIMTDLLILGGELMVVGMGIVFLFLTMLVFAVNLMPKLIERYMARPPVTDAGSVTPIAAHRTALDPRLVAAISAAIHQYRNSRS